jgi:nicotinate phosphoribosyltransferase
MPRSTALFTDRYELTMLDSALESKVAGKNASFEVFARSLYGRSFALIAGSARLAQAIESFVFDDETLSYLSRERIVSRPTIRYLENFRFSGSVYAYQEGEPYFPYSPVVRVDATFGEGLILETLILSILNFDSAVATAAARMSLAASGRSLIEMGSRRTNEEAAVMAARAAYIGGFDSTSNMAAGYRFGIPTAGTVGHALILAHPSEEEAFITQHKTMGNATTALVDTYDVEMGIQKAVKVFGPELSAIRIDSGNLAVGARRARELLNELGATKTKIIVSGDLDEAILTELACEPIDGYGIGTKVVTGSGVPTCGFVYKLVAIEDESGTYKPVAKLSEEKASDGGRKTGYRLLREGQAVAELSFDPDVELSSTEYDELRNLQVPVVLEGKPQTIPGPSLARAHAKKALSELGEPKDLLARTEPLFTCLYQGPGLRTN